MPDEILNNPLNFTKLGQRRKPDDLTRITPLLRIVEKHYPTPIEVPNPAGKQHDSLRHDINKPIQSWLKHRWAATGLDIKWWSTNFPAIHVATDPDTAKLYICPKGTKFKDVQKIGTASLIAESDEVHYVFDSEPEDDILQAFLVLFQGDYLPGQIRFNFIPKVTDYPDFDNVMFFQPEGEDYWVMF